MNWYCFLSIDSNSIVDNPGLTRSIAVHSVWLIWNNWHDVEIHLKKGFKESIYLSIRMMMLVEKRDKKSIGKRSCQNDLDYFFINECYPTIKFDWNKYQMTLTRDSSVIALQMQNQIIISIFAEILSNRPFPSEATEIRVCSWKSIQYCIVPFSMVGR